MSLTPETGTVQETATTAARTRGVIAYLIWFWLPVAAWMAAIFYGSSRHSLPGPLSWPSTAGFIMRKATHMTEYAALFVLLHRALAAARPTRSRLAAQARGHRSHPLAVLGFVQAFAISLVFALSDELHQRLVPERDATLVDVGWDMLGTLAGLAVVMLSRAVHARSARRKPPLSQEV